MWRGLALLMFAACWTGHEPVVTEPTAVEDTPKPRRAPLPPLRVVLERTGCLGPCPSYSVTIRSNGSVEWLGESNVSAIGTRIGVVGRAELDRLAHAIDKARFFELDESGHIPSRPSCVRTGNTVSCSMSSFTMCTDTSHALITVIRGTQIHQVDDAHCSDQDSALIQLEDLIDDIGKTDAWIGR
jgi:hypothetical protein